jgi:hypothetical protein
MENVHQAGTQADIATRILAPRQDSQALQQIIQDARHIIYQQGKLVKSAAVESLLKPQSLVPTVVCLASQTKPSTYLIPHSHIQNAFSELFLSIQANFYDIFVVDFLHEFELGVWKAVLVHLIRILHACGEDRIREFNYRYVSTVLISLCSQLISMRETPLFGLDTIRRFSDDVSELRKMAARDYEDILQACSISLHELLLTFSLDNHSSDRRASRASP